MSDVEEPPHKVTKMDMSAEYLEDEEEGQEEWLSEEILTDDDFNDVRQSLVDKSTNESNAGLEAEVKVEHLEEVLEDSTNKVDAYLVTKVNAPQEDDGNDTDDLLRMLGGDEKREKKSVLKIVQKPAHVDDQSTDDDDEYIFEGSKLTKLRIAKNALITTRKPTMAEPEDMSDEDADGSSDEASLVKNMFNVKKNVASKSTAKSSVPQRPQNNTQKNKESTLTKPNILRTINTKPLAKTVNQQPKPVKTYSRASMLANKSDDKLSSKLDDGEYQTNEDYLKLLKEDEQKIMRPERMEEDFLSDESSASEDSMFDDMPTSDSDDMEDWFTLDIRNERAADYIPLLGASALSTLENARRHAEERIATLRARTNSAAEAARVHRDLLAKAALNLSHLDHVLRAL